MRQATIRALEIRDEADIIRGLDRGELEARILVGERAQASAPTEVSRTLRLTAQAEADALRQSVDAQAQHDETTAASAAALAARLAVERQRLEADNTRYEHWVADTNDIRETAGKAQAELRRRGQAEPDPQPQARPGNEPQAIARWWREFDAGLQAVECAIARQRQATIDAGKPWPPPRSPEPDPVPTQKRSPEDQSVPAQLAQDDRTARLEELLARANHAAQRLAAQQAGREGDDEYATRLEREAQVHREAEQQAQACGGAEIEM